MQFWPTSRARSYLGSPLWSFPETRPEVFFDNPDGFSTRKLVAGNIDIDRLTDNFRTSYRKNSCWPRGELPEGRRVDTFQDIDHTSGEQAADFRRMDSPIIHRFERCELSPTSWRIRANTRPFGDVTDCPESRRRIAEGYRQPLLGMDSYLGDGKLSPDYSSHSIGLFSIADRV